MLTGLICFTVLAAAVRGVVGADVGDDGIGAVGNSKTSCASVGAAGGGIFASDIRGGGTRKDCNGSGIGASLRLIIRCFLGE